MARHVTESDSQVANFQSTYTTVQSNSGSWGGGGGDDTAVSTKVRASSANWDNVYSTVQNLSSTWTDSPSPSYYRKIESDFEGATASVAGEGIYGTVISSGTIASGTSDPDHPGVAILRDSTTANGGYRIMSDVTSFRIAGGERFRTIFQIGTTALSGTIRMGFHDTTTFAMPTDGVWFGIQGFSDGYYLSGMTRANSTAIATSTNYKLVSAAWYRAELEVNSAASLVTYTLYSSGGAQLWTDTINSQIPTAAGRETGFGFIATEPSTNAATDIVRLDWYAMEINRTLTR